MRKCIWFLLLVFVGLWLAQCTQPAKQPAIKPAPEELKRFPLDSIEGAIAQSNVSFDPGTSADGKGSLKIELIEGTTVPLFEVSNLKVEDAFVVYQAKIKSQNLQGRAYLEMWCRITGKGEFFSRGLQQAISGTNEWSSQETTFFVKKGQICELVKLNFVVEGQGTIWIDDIRLLKRPL